MDLTQAIHADTHRPTNEAVAASAVSRAVIEQAKGILMARAGLNAMEAFQQISSSSQRSNRKIVIIVQEIIDGALKLTAHNQHHSPTDASGDPLDLRQAATATVS